ncbi:MAG: DUF4838 domain-containing protein [Lentisphaeria bacterium]
MKNNNLNNCCHAVFSLFFLLLNASLLGEDIVPFLLAEHGEAHYLIVVPEQLSPLDQLAQQELQTFLERCSGAAFEAVVDVSKNAAQNSRRIFLGLGPLAKKLLSENNFSVFMRPGEIVMHFQGQDIFLYGEGLHGNLHAVYEFLERRLGCLWLSAYGDMHIPKKETLAVSTEDSRIVYALPIRSLMNWFYKDKQAVSLFQGRNRQNILLIERQPGIINSCRTLHPSHHSFAYYMPGFQGGNMAKPLDWLAEKDYFSSHQEFFSMDEKGERVNNRQLCFSNHELRQELTKNVLEQYRREKEKGGKDGIVTIECNDIAYNICCCPGCKKLQEKYQAEGGPLFDYLIEISRAYPEITFRTLAYQRGQTQRPPVLTEKLPENFLVTFAPINGNFAASMEESKFNQRDLSDLLQWSRLTKKIWLWYYPNPYRSGNFFIPPPLGNLGRLAADIRLMHRLGLEGSYFEHDSGGIKSGSNFSELQSWVMLRLFQNPDQELDELVQTFTDAYYGAAAPIMRQLLSELEAEREDFVKQGGFWSWNSMDYHYLTETNFQRWTNYYEQAEALATGDAVFRVKLSRLGLDSAILAKISYENFAPGKFTLLSQRMERTLQELFVKRQLDLRDDFRLWLAERREEVQMQPLPPEFAELSPEILQLSLPDFGRLDPKLVVRDAEAAIGKAVYEVSEGGDYQLLTYDYVSKKYGGSRIIKKEQIQLGGYHFYQLSSAMRLSPDMVLHGAKWQICVPLKKLCSYDDLVSLAQKWEIQVSLKFSGPSYDVASSEKEDRVLCDRVVLIKRP